MIVMLSAVETSRGITKGALGFLAFASLRSE